MSADTTTPQTFDLCPQDARALIGNARPQHRQAVADAIARAVESLYYAYEYLPDCRAKLETQKTLEAIRCAAEDEARGSIHDTRNASYLHQITRYDLDRSRYEGRTLYPDSQTHWRLWRHGKTVGSVSRVWVSGEVTYLQLVDAREPEEMRLFDSIVPYDLNSST